MRAPAGLLLGLIFFLGTPLDQAHASETSQYPRLRFQGNLWGSWNIDLSNANPDAPTPNGANRFELIRTYLDFRADLSPSISIRVTPDLVATQGTDGNVDGSLLLRLKYAYLTFSDVVGGLSVRALMQPTPYIGFSDRIWGYRVLGPDALDFFNRAKSSDLGVGVQGNWGKVWDTEILLANGEGFSAGESTSRNAAKYKDIAARLTFSPFGGSSGVLRRLSLSGFVQYGIHEQVPDLDDDLFRFNALALATWQLPWATFGAGGGYSRDDSLLTSDGAPPRIGRDRDLMLTSWGWVDLPYRFRAIGRYDLLDPVDDEGGGVGARGRIIAGLAYRATDDVQIIADWQRFSFERPEEVSRTTAGDRLFLHLAAEF